MLLKQIILNVLFLLLIFTNANAMQRFTYGLLRIIPIANITTMNGVCQKRCFNSGQNTYKNPFNPKEDAKDFNMMDNQYKMVADGNFKENDLIFYFFLDQENADSSVPGLFREEENLNRKCVPNVKKEIFRTNEGRLCLGFFACRCIKKGDKLLLY